MHLIYEPCHEKTSIFAYAKTNLDQLCSNCTVDQLLCFRYRDCEIPLPSKSKISSLSPSLWLYNPFFVEPGLTLRRQVFSLHSSYHSHFRKTLNLTCDDKYLPNFVSPSSCNPSKGNILKNLSTDATSLECTEASKRLLTITFNLVSAS